MQPSGSLSACTPPDDRHRTPHDVPRLLLTMAIRRLESFRWKAAAMIVAASLLGLPLGAQRSSPFKLGTFERQGRTFVGVVLRDALVIDLPSAMRAGSTTVTPPADMKQLIGGYDGG